MSNNGRTTDVSFWKSLYSGTVSSWDSYYGNGSGYGTSYYDRDWSSGKTKRRHEFSPVLLVYTTVYDCKHCNRKKEDCKHEYCDDEDTPPTYMINKDIGDWG